MTLQAYYRVPCLALANILSPAEERAFANRTVPGDRSALKPVVKCLPSFSFLSLLHSIFWIRCNPSSTLFPKRPTFSFPRTSSSTSSHEDACRSPRPLHCYSSSVRSPAGQPRLQALTKRLYVGIDCVSSVACLHRGSLLSRHLCFHSDLW